MLLKACLLFSQSGPGGLGKTDGSSNLVLWLKGDAGVLNAGVPATNGQTVNTWQDQSGNGYHALLGGGTPLLTSTNANFNNRPTISFDGTGDWLYVEDSGDEAPLLDNTSELSVFYVFRTAASGTKGHLSKRNQSGANGAGTAAQSYVFYESGAINSRVNSNTDAGATPNATTTYINSLTYQNGDFDHWLNQTDGGGLTGGTSTIPNNNSDLHIGTFHALDGREFNGNMAEIIIFRQYLTNAQRIVMESYLGSKYGITLGNDYWDQTTYASYNNEIAGIGQHTDGSIANSATSAVVTISGGDGRANGEWFFWGHDNGGFASYTTTEIVTGSRQQRLAREWVVNETGDLGNVTVSVAATSLPSTGLPSVTFYLLVDTDGDANFANATSYPMTLNGSNYEVSLNLANGNRFALAYVPPVPANVSGTLAFWFSSSAGVEHTGSAATDGQTVTVWQDLSSNNGDGQNGTSPIYYSTKKVNFQPVVRFSRASSQYLQFGMSPLQNSDYTLFSVVRRLSATGSQYILGSESTNADAFLMGYSSNTSVDSRNSSTATVSATVSAFNSPVQGPSLSAVTYNSINLGINQYRNGVSTGTTATAVDYTGAYTGNLGRGLNSNYLDADVLEVVGFSSVLSAADYNAVVSNLSMKYGITTGSNYLDELGTVLWNATTNSSYPNNVAAIGYDLSFGFDTRVTKSASDSVILATTADFTSLNSSGARTALSDGQFTFISNDGDPFTKNQSFNGVSNSRLDRTWSVREVNTPGAIYVALPASVGVNVMLVSADPTFATGVVQTPMSSSGSYVFASYNFTDGDYVTFVSDVSQVWYSYISGNWTNPLSWTLDGAISALYVNPNNEIPSAGDSVVIRSGRTIAMVGNAVKVTKIELSGTLDLGATSSHNFGYLEGSGTLRLSGSSGLDNYPSAIDSLFYDTSEGGTVEIYGTGVTLNANRKYNNLIINTTSSTDIVTQTASSVQVYGNVSITNGTYRVNDNAATTSLLWEIYGNLTVQANGKISVGTANARHDLNLYGNFTNQGVVAFTNRISQTTGSEATNGIVDVNFVSGNKDQTITLQNTTNFYRIEINKGVDPTYTAYFSATNASYFKLFGAANYNHGSVAQLNPAANENPNAVGLYYGTLSLGTNISVGALTTNGNYNVSTGSTLQLDGGTATISGNAIVPYGNIVVNSGTLSAPVTSGITTRGNGTLTVNGGTVTMNQFRTSVLGATNQGGIIQTGGIINITGGSTSTTYYLFNLTYSGNVFNMSGGTLNISGANAKGLIFINSDVENISITGGTVNLTSNNTNSCVISSRSPFYNLTLNKTTGTGGSFINASGSSGPGGTEETVGNVPLTVLNNFTINNTGNTTTYNANGKSVSIIGDLLIQSGASINMTNTKLIFEGVGASDFNIQLATTLTLDSLEINKSNGQVDVNIINGQPTALLINNYLNIQNGNLDLGTFNVTVNGNISIKDTVGTSTSTGKIFMNGAAAQTINSTSGAIYNFEVNNTNGVTLTGAFGAIKTFQLNGGVFNIGTSKLTCGSEITTAGSFSTTRMIQMAGNASDGGLEYYFDGLTANPAAILFPIGTNANSTVRYTPATMDLSIVGDNGYVAINISDTELLTTNLSGGNILSYYWKSTNRSFSAPPKVTYAFTYASSDDNATDEANFVPGKVLDSNPFTRSSEQQSNVNTGANVITFNNNGSNFNLENANYTAGRLARFTGAVEIYYSRVSNGNWVNYTTNSSWSTTGHQGAAASDYPKVGDVAIIGHTYIGGGTGRHQIQGPTADITIAALIFDSQSGGTAFNVSDMSRLRIRGNRTLTVGTVSGTGEMVQDIGTATQTATITGDLGSFIAQKNNGWFFWFQSSTAVTISDRFIYPVFRTFGSSGAALSFSQDVTAHGAVIDSDTELRVTTNFTLDSLVQIGSNLSGAVSFRSGASNLTFECGSIVFSNDPSNNVSVVNTGTNIHRLIVNENITLTTGTAFDLTSASGSQVELELAGSGNHSFTNNTGVTADLYRVIVNKGSGTSSSFTFNDNFTLTGTVTSQPQALELQNGNLILNDPAINILLATNSEFDVPSSAGLEVTQGTLTSTNATIKLNGRLKVNGGTVNLNTSDIEYSNTGTAIVEVSSGVLKVGGQIRRATTSSTGVLKYRQTGGDVDIATDGAATTSRGAFEILNTGSEFTLTGGTFNIARGVTGDANKSLELAPETYDLTGSTITLFENLGSNYGANYFNIKSSIPLNNLTIANTINMPDVRLYTQSLQVNSLTINTNQAFIANSFNITINGNITNDGSFTNNSAETILAGSGAQAIGGSGTWSLYDLRKSGSGTTTQNVSLTLKNNLYLTSGTLNIGSNSLSLKKDAYVESTLTNSGGNGLVFNGIANQNLYGLSNNTVSIGTITINTTSGVDIPDGNGYDFDITQNLRLAGGVFNIGGSLVTIKPGATITEVSTFNVNNMVQTNSSFTDNGLKIEFNTLGSNATAFFPVGELKYTPVAFNLNSGTTAGSIRVRPANERHPTIIDDTEPGTETSIDDLANVLKYYWIVIAQNLTNANGNATFYYNHSDIGVTSPYDTSSYISARLLSNGVTWDKLAPTFFRGANQTFVVPLSNYTASEITGDYTAGVGSSNGTTNNIQGAIPDMIAQYETNFVGAGNYSLATNWSPLGSSPAVTNGVGPVGAQIIVRNGDDLTLNLSNIRLYSTKIENGGILRVPSGVTGIRLGTVTGNGTIVIEDTELLPTGEYSAFFACDGGAIQYSGTTTYSVLSGISQIRKVIFEGSGTRTMPNNNLSVCDSLIINGPTVAFNSGRTRNIGDADTDRMEIQAGAVTLSNGTILNINGDFVMSGGSFTGSTGTRVEVTDDVTFSGGSLNWNGTSVWLDGASSQDISGNFTGTSAFTNLQLNNSSTNGVTITGGSIAINGVLTFTDGFFNTTTSQSLTISSSGSWTGATSASYVTGPMTKNSVAAASTYQFPVGKSTRYAPMSIVNVVTGGQNWTSEYFTSTNPTYSNTTFDPGDPGSGFNPLTSVKSTDRWQVTSSGSNTSQIRLTYGSHDGFTFTENIRVVWWDGVDARWENQGGNPVTGTTSSGKVISENYISFSTQQFALGNAPESTLPVELLNFGGRVEDNAIVLDWQTATEINNAYFELQYSLDGSIFTSLGKIEGHGNTKTLQSYAFIHKSPELGLNFYRLRQVDFDGAEEIFKMIVVEYSSGRSSKLELELYPNPSNRLEALSLSITTEDNHTPIYVQCINMLGQVVLQKVVESGVSSFETSPMDLPAGIYLMVIKQGSHSIIERLIVN